VSAFTVDIPRLYQRLDQERERHQLTWKQVAAETGISASTFSRMATGHAPDADALCTLLMWLGLSLRAFVVPTSRPGPDGPPPPDEQPTAPDPLTPVDGPPTRPGGR